MIPLSPGVAFGCMELLNVACRNAVTPTGVLSLSLGSIPSRTIYEAAIGLQWLEVNADGLLGPTARGERALSQADDRVRLRSMLVDYIDLQRPAWLQLAPAGRRETLLQAPPGIRQIFVEAGLAYGEDDQTVAFWDGLAARARGVRDAAMSEVGRRGERLTIAHELMRTGFRPKWIALESSTDGYDVLSRLSGTDSRRLTIEVKASERPLPYAVFHLTRNEWETAETALCHRFHLWELSTPEPRLASLVIDDVRGHVPANQGQGSWEAVTIPFGAFADRFRD